MRRLDPPPNGGLGAPPSASVAETACTAGQSPGKAVRVVTGHQPVYLPWAGLFHKIALADVFVFMDDVQYLTQDWNNRNRIKGPHGPFWLTVPVRRRASASGLIKDILVDDSGHGTSRHWQQAHWVSLTSCYGQAPYWAEHAAFLEEFYTQRCWKWLVDVNETLLVYLLQALGITTVFIKSSAYGFEGRKSQLVLDHCLKLQADMCVLGLHGREYLDEAPFLRAGVSIYYQDYSHPRYTQRFGPFASHLSVLDLLLNCGPCSRDVLTADNITRADLIRAAAGRTADVIELKPAEVK